MDKIIKHNFLSNDWCVPERCPCLTCEYWLNGDPKCACKPCEQKGLRQPEKVICYKTSGGEFGKYDVFDYMTGERL